MNWNVFVTRKISTAGVDLLHQHCARVDQSNSEVPLTSQSLLTEVRDRDGILVMGNDRVDAPVFDAAGGKLRVVSNFSVGYNNIEVAEATRRKIAVTNTPGVLTEATADLTWALILAVARRVVEGDRMVRAGQWQGWTPTQMLGVDLAGKTLGIVGAGRIGAAVARRATGFAMRILYNARSAHADIEALGAQRATFDELLRESDFLTVHVPLTSETRHMFGEKQFRAMKPTAFFINMARGPVHDEAALVRALREGWIGGAGLDVYENEPQFHPDLVKSPNTVLLPHLGSATVETRTRMSLMAAENLLAVLRGEKCANVVNPEVL